MGQVKKLMLLLVVCLVLVAPAMATSAENIPMPIHYWHFDDGDTTSSGINGTYADLTDNGGLEGLAGIIGLSINSTGGTPDYENSTMANMGLVKTVDMWVQHASVAAGNRNIWNINEDASNYRSCAIQASGKLRCFGAGNLGAYEITSGSNMPLGQWNHIVFSNGPGGVRIWMNNVEIGNNTGVTANFSSVYDDFCIGYQCAPPQEAHTAGFDNIAFLMSEANSTYVNASYNEGAGFNFSSLVVPPVVIGDNITFGLNNILNKTTISEFNVTVTNGTFTQTYNSTSNPELVITNLSNDAFYNITIQSVDHLNIFISDVNLTNTTHNYSVAQGWANITASGLITGTSFNNFFTTNGLYTNSTTSTISTVPVNLGLNNLLVSSETFYGSNITINFTSIRTNTTYDFLASNARLQVNLTTQGLPISTFNATVSNITYSFTNLSNTTNNSIFFWVEQNTTFDIFIAAEDYLNVSNNFTLATNDTQITYSTVIINAINFTFYNELDRSLLLNGTKVLDIISDAFAINLTFSAANSTGFTANLPAGPYELRYRSDGFRERRKFVDFSSSQGLGNVSLYLLDNENSTDVNFVITDQFGDELENATIIAQRYYLDENGFIAVSEERTNFIGEAQMGLQRFNVFYRFVIMFEERILFTSTSTEIVEDPESFNFQVNTGEDTVEGLENLWSVTSELNFSNSSTPNFFSLTYVNPTGLESDVCLEVYRTTLADGRVLFNSTCLTTSSGTINIGINETNQSQWDAQALWINKGQVFVINSRAENLLEAFKTFGLQGVWWMFILTGIVVAGAIFNPFVGIVMALVSLAIGYLMGLGAGSLLSFMIISAIGIFLLVKIKT